MTVRKTLAVLAALAVVGGGALLLWGGPSGDGENPAEPGTSAAGDPAGPAMTEAELARRRQQLERLRPVPPNFQIEPPRPAPGEPARPLPAFRRLEGVPGSPANGIAAPTGQTIPISGDLLRKVREANAEAAARARAADASPPR